MRRTLSLPKTDRRLRWILGIVSALTGAIVLFILGFLLRESAPVLSAVGWMQFIKDPSWHPREGLYDLTPMVAGTLLVTVAALLAAVPLGVLSGLFCRFYAPPSISRIYRALLQLLAGIPSVVYGFWGLVVLVPRIAAIRSPGTSLLAGAVVMALMILPTIALAADASFAAVPQDELRGAAALGLGRSAAIRGVVLPFARSGLFTGILLAVGRALGETMAVLMLCGNIVEVPSSLFDPMRTLAANIALEMAYATGTHRSALFFSGVILMVLIGFLVLSAEAVERRVVGE